MNKSLFLACVLMILFISVGCGLNDEENRPIHFTDNENIGMQGSSQPTVGKLQKEEIDKVNIESVDTARKVTCESNTANYKLVIDANVYKAENLLEKAIYRHTPFTQEDILEYENYFTKDAKTHGEYVGLNINEGFGIGNIGVNVLTKKAITSAELQISNFKEEEKNCGLFLYNNIVTPNAIDAFNMGKQPITNKESEWFGTEEKLKALIDISEEESILEAKKVLKAFNISGFAVRSVYLKPQTIDGEHNAYYEINFMRQGEINTNPYLQELTVSGLQALPTSKYLGESISVAVDDYGISGFCHTAKKEQVITQKVNWKVIDIQSAIDILQDNIEEILSDQNILLNSTVQIEEIILGFAYEESENTNMLRVPAWDFKGHIINEENSNTLYSITVINAIDGGIISCNVEKHRLMSN